MKDCLILLLLSVVEVDIAAYSVNVIILCCGIIMWRRPS
uniref:Uncharacterized protein n=1 Tax=Zea mays TaxID=4577 RepID=B4FZ73_MAIZE|nr:unknown [Zea mays]